MQTTVLALWLISQLRPSPARCPSPDADVRAAIVTSWSNGQTEGQITKPKLVKRQMYGRGKLDLLEARLVGPAWL